MGDASLRHGPPGEAVLPPGGPELVEGPNGTQHIALTGIFKEAQEAGAGVPAHGELSKRQPSAATGTATGPSLGPPPSQNISDRP